MEKLSKMDREKQADICGMIAFFLMMLGIIYDFVMLWLN